MRGQALHIVTGGAGFIGSNVAADLAARGARVVVIDRLEQGEKWRNLAEVALYDVIPPEVAWRFFAGAADRIAAIVHMGAISATTETDVDKLVRENIRFSLDLWEHCAAKAIPFFYASSAATYGDGAAGFEDDAAPEGLARLTPLNAYAWSKHVVDRRIARDAREGLACPPRWAGLKFFNVYGPREAHKGPMRSVALQIFEAIQEGRPVRLFRSHRPDFADGGQLRDFVAVQDCVSVLRWMLETEFPGGLYNVGTGQARSWLDLAHAVFAACGRAPKIDFIDTPEPLRARYQYFTEADMRRLRAAGYQQPFLSLEAGVAAYVRWLQGAR